MNKVKFTLRNIVVIFLLMLGFVSCAKRIDDAMRVGISMPTLQEERWQRDRDIIIEELMLLGIEKKNIFVQSADGDEQKQV